MAFLQCPKLRPESSQSIDLSIFPRITRFRNYSFLFLWTTCIAWTIIVYLQWMFSDSQLLGTPNWASGPYSVAIIGELLVLPFMGESAYFSIFQVWDTIPRVGYAKIKIESFLAMRK